MYVYVCVHVCVYVYMLGGGEGVYRYMWVRMNGCRCGCLLIHGSGRSFRKERENKGEHGGKRDTAHVTYAQAASPQCPSPTSEGRRGRGKVGYIRSFHDAEQTTRILAALLITHALRRRIRAKPFLFWRILCINLGRILPLLCHVEVW